MHILRGVMGVVGTDRRVSDSRHRRPSLPSWERRGLEELRVKESDRIAVMAAGLRAIGVNVEELPDGLIVDGRGGEPFSGGATVAAHLDHRIAMSFAIAGLVSKHPVTIDDIAPVATSFPTFEALLQEIGA